MMIRRHFLLCGAASVALGTRGHAQPMPGMTGPHGAPATQPPGPAQGGLVLLEGEPLRSLPKLPNMTGRPGAFSGTLVAAPTQLQLAPGKATEILAYNGVSPGPLIEVTEGDKVAITFKNKIRDNEHEASTPVESATVFYDAAQVKYLHRCKGCKRRQAGFDWHHEMAGFWSEFRSS